MAADVLTLQLEVNDLTAQVAASTTVENSAVILITGFAAKLQAAIDAATAAGATPEILAQVVQLKGALSDSAASLAAAVAANTAP